ncbi:hypothetical protein RF11_09662 [Thelohanellus kitauei]|uniref:Uncharacterized protein n=1 Tax=Thelohanellus kitauei TaxID=669202 RepID=A0A0C2ICJ3_THEKT|nr:hypothetical protein RF11_09662 [Thelohanellus kitauei]
MVVGGVTLLLFVLAHWLIASTYFVIRNPCFGYEECETCISNSQCMWVLDMVASFMIEAPYMNSSDTQEGRRHCVVREPKTLQMYLNENFGSHSFNDKWTDDKCDSHKGGKNAYESLAEYYRRIRFMAEGRVYKSTPYLCERTVFSFQHVYDPRSFCTTHAFVDKAGLHIVPKKVQAYLRPGLVDE